MSDGRNEFRYQVNSDSFDDSFEITTGRIVYGVVIDYELEEIAQEAAEDYFHQHDGWESVWPIDFYIYENDKLIGVCNVEKESQPLFTARHKDR